jgi:HK97 family phage prohead protease
MMEQNKKEIRNITAEVTVDEESRTVEGYAMLFNVPSDGLDIEEIIEPRALDGVIEKSNVFALLNHDERRGILARSKKGVGTLSLTVDGKGLRYRFDAPRTALGDELLEYLKRGEVTESSFAFTVAEDVWEKKGETWKRTIKKIDELYDVSPVYDAAYSKTTVYMRGKEQLEQELREQRERELDAYYTNLNKFLN